VFIGGKLGNIGDACFTSWQPDHKAFGEPWCFTVDSIDYFTNELGIGALVHSRTLYLLDRLKSQRFFMFVQYEEPDVPGIHFNGAHTREYRRELRQVDRYLGEVMAWLEDNDLADDTIVYVTTDHGAGDGLAHRNAPYGIYATNDPGVVREADRLDFAPTFLELYGLSPDDYEPAIDGRSLYRHDERACIPEGEAYVDYEDAPLCCPGAEVISLARDKIHGNPKCVEPVGGDLDESGYCTVCGNGSCDAPENRCNCAQDCGG